jgi:hypothetical protein
MKRTYKNKELMKKNLKKVHQVRSVRETYEWWREQETNEYEVDSDYLYTPEDIRSLSDISSLDSLIPDDLYITEYMSIPSDVSSLDRLIP